MRSQLFLKRRHAKNWNETTSYPSSAPSSDYDYDHIWWHDLIDSTNHSLNGSWRTQASIRDVGSNFWVIKQDYTESSSLGDADLDFSHSEDPTANGSPHFVGRQYPRAYWFDRTTGVFPGSPHSSTARLQELGTTAMARCAPNKPQADLASFLGEMREGLPSAIGLTRTGRERSLKSLNAGSEYLNVEFGWKPLVRDVQSFARSVTKSHQILKDFHANSGKLIRTKYEFPVEHSETRTDHGSNLPLPLLPAGLYGSSPFGELTQTTKSYRKVWFKGTWSYYVPPPSNKFDKWRGDAQYLLGADLSPNMLWNVAPWTWAADWFGNGGDVASNLTNFSHNNLVLWRGYIMETAYEEHNWTLRGSNMWKTYPGEHTLSQTFRTTSKRRIRATPYGFGINWNELSSKQLGILAALGVSRLD